ncbi:hypothetical protein GC102_00310 [Paenibacillus sp. LMG 31460]|uniref:DNA mismatch repair protein n=1 Tax=Paenibacillus germinis TaxID=2654979 RepID=A0ABX1YWU5_9BACL|nr:hypothetical protein [Paenibacillus germinis]NOU84233.1 hypothetical protein [Paenibacillus germinis]
MLVGDELYIATRRYLIDYGMRHLNGLGADHICKVCIQNGGSCCRSCNHLVDRVGCQNRNTSCTAWLCGYLKLLFYKAGLIKNWHTFWDEVPGIDFRKDFTPPLVKMTTHLEVPMMRELGEALANDLKLKLSRDKDNIDFIVLASDLDELIDEIEFAGNSDISTQLIKRLNYLIKDFHEFQQAIKNIELHKWGEKTTQV